MPYTPYRDVVLDNTGNAIAGASVLIKTYPGGVNATLYSSNTGSGLGNPVTTDGNGEFNFFIGAGDYTATVSGTGITTFTTDPFFVPVDSTIVPATSITVNLAADVTGVLPIANGGTGAATATNAFTALAPSQSGKTGYFLSSNGTAASWNRARGYHDAVLEGGMLTTNTAAQNATCISNLNTLAAASGLPIVLDVAGTYQYTGVINLTTQKWILGRNVILEATGTNNYKWSWSGDGGGIEGPGIGSGACIRAAKHKHYIVTAVTPVGDGISTDLTIGTHDFTTSDTVTCQLIAMNSGTNTLNNLHSIVITATTATTIRVRRADSAASVAATVTYPLAMYDGSGNSVYPRVFRARTDDGTSDLIQIQAAASNVTIKGIKLQWSRNTGCINFGATGCITREVEVYQTAADGLHHTNGVSYQDVIDCEVHETGDDGIAFVGYTTNAAKNHHVRICGCYVYDVLWTARGITVLGTNNVKILDCRAENTYSAGLYIGSETNAYGCEDVEIDNLHLKTNGVNGPWKNGWHSTSHGSLQINPVSTGGYKRMTRIRIGILTIENARWRAINGGDTAAVMDLKGDHIRIEDVGEYAIGGLAIGQWYINDLVVRRARNGAWDLSNTQTPKVQGYNEFDSFRFSDLNVGTRKYISSASCAGQILTVTLGSGQTPTFVVGDVVAFQGFSANSITGDAAAAIPFNFNAVNGSAFTLTTGTSGDTLKVDFTPKSVSSITRGGTGNLTATMTTASAHNLQVGWQIVVTGANEAAYNGTYTIKTTPSATTLTYLMASDPGGSATGSPAYTLGTSVNTTNIQCTTPAQACPQAYVSLQSGASSGQDAIIVGTNLSSDQTLGPARIRIKRLICESAVYVLERMIDIDTSSSPYFHIEEPIDLSSYTGAHFGGQVRMTGFTNTQRYDAALAYSTDANNTTSTNMIDTMMRGGVYYRTGMTADRTDTLPTPAAIIAALSLAQQVYFQWGVANRTGYFLTLSANGNTLFPTTMVVPPMTTVDILIYTTGSTAVTIQIFQRKAPIDLIPAVISPTSQANVNGVTMTTKDILGQFYARSTQNAGQTDTTPTGPDIILDGGLVRGSQFMFTYSNTDADNITLAGGAGVIIDNAASITATALREKRFRVRCLCNQTATVTMTIASPCVVTWTSHSLSSGMSIVFTTTGALPTGITAGNTYWITVIDANTFNISSSIANYLASTFVNTSGSQSGTHTGTARTIEMTTLNTVTVA